VEALPNRRALLFLDKVLNTTGNYPCLGYSSLFHTLKFHLRATLSKTIYSAQYQAFLNRLRQARKDKGMTQVQVASSLGKHQSYVAKCENGERRVDVVELAEFAKLYKKPLDYFLS
jgi:DNA-binding XRE family transcriptional regulator